MAKSKFTGLIENFCRKNGITIPPGFYRHPASRYVVIRKQGGTWSLVARTWFAVADIVNYLDNYAEDADYRVFDFEEFTELSRRGANQLKVIGNIDDLAQQSAAADGQPASRLVRS